MPQDYQKTVTLRMKVYEQAKKRAERRGMKVATHVTDLILRDLCEEMNS